MEFNIKKLHNDLVNQILDCDLGFDVEEIQTALINTNNTNIELALEYLYFLQKEFLYLILIFFYIFYKN